VKSPSNVAPAQAGGPWDFARLRRITTASHRYIAEVDGLRFIAIFMVMLFHVYYNVAHAPGRTLAPSALDITIWPVQQGFRGVQLFFVISGFILGLPFASHYLAGGPPVRIGRFYLRRVTRLEPPYILALLLIYVAAVLMHNVHTKEADFRSSLPLRLVYAYLFVHQRGPTLNGVTWSLEIEVQFYLLAPLLARVFKLADAHRRWLLVALICGSPVIAHVVPRGNMCLLGFLQFFLTGFLLADIHCTGTGAGKIATRAYDWLGIGCLLVTALVPETSIFEFFLPWILGVLFIGALRGDWFTSFLRRPLVAVTGGMCYSLYLLHNPILSFFTDRTIVNGLSLPQAYLRLLFVGMPFVMFAGITYYILIERPCMNPNWPQEVVRCCSRKFRAPSKTVITSPASYGE
jgi:peptidoglycan/LPS O-acetylase OafA/YrhL